MKKNILNKEVKDEIVIRIQQLKPSLQPLWGSMNVIEMMHHCREALRRTMMVNTDDYKKTTLKQAIAKFYILNIASRFPKNAKAPALIDMRRIKPNLGSFDRERENLIERIQEFQQNRNKLIPNHPAFGRLTNNEWGIFTCMHLDHHLRQFEV
jgi:hypothetical protein